MLPHDDLIDLLDLFDAVEGSDRLTLLLDFGDRLPPLPEAFHELRDAGQHLIHECQAPVFLLPVVTDSHLRIYADVPREAPIARGFTAMLVETFDGCLVDVLAAAPDDLLMALGLTPLLSFQRRRGLGAIYRALRSAVPAS